MNLRQSICILSLALLAGGGCTLDGAPPRAKKPGRAKAAILRSEAELEADILLARAKLLRDEGKFREAADVMLKIRGMGGQVTIPPEFHFHLAACLDKADTPDLAAESYREYLRQSGREGNFYGLALEALAKAEATAKMRREAQAQAEAARARAARLERSLLEIEQELARLRTENAQTLAHLDAETDKVTAPFFAAFDALPWPEKVYAYTTGKLANFNRHANYYYFKVTPGTREGRPIRTLYWGVSAKPEFNYRVEVDVRRLRDFQVFVREGFSAEFNRYDIIYTTWNLKDGEHLVEYDSPLWWRPFTWDTEKGHLAQVKRLEEILAPCVKLYTEARPQFLERMNRMARLRESRDQLRRQLRTGG